MITFLRPIVRRARERIEALRVSGRPIDGVFQQIYERNHWRGSESASGTGSDLRQTAVITAALPVLLRRHGVRSMLDIPCGDFHWMSRVDLAGVDYIGADIVGAGELVVAPDERRTKLAMLARNQQIRVVREAVLTGTARKHAPRATASAPARMCGTACARGARI